MSQPGTLLLELQTSADSWVEVGFLRKLGSRNWFEFSDGYWGLARRPILGQIFEEQGRAYHPSSHVALPHWFSHLLPEGRLRQAVAAAAQASAMQEFELLARLGHDDLPGALRATPVKSPDDLSSPPAAMAELENQKADDPLLKFSLAGAQLKFSVYADNRGLTVPARGQAGNVILKFPDGRPGYSGVPEAELAALRLAMLSGIPTPHAQLWNPSNVEGLEKWAERVPGQALAVHRFDRQAHDTRVHMEELAQVMNIPTKPEDMKYRKANFETVALHVSALCGTTAVEGVIDRIVLNVVIGNGDAHLKNWAFLYLDGRTPTLSPVYDVLPTVLYVPNDDLGLRLAGTKRFEDVTSASFGRLGERSGYGADTATRRAKEAVARVMSNWLVLKDYLSQEQYDFLTERQASLALLHE